MAGQVNKLGIDIGTMYLKIAMADSQDNLLKQSVYVAHKGNPLKSLREEVKRHGIGSDVSMCVTGACATQLQDCYTDT